MLKRKEECDTYLTHICRYHCSGENPMKRWNIRCRLAKVLAGGTLTPFFSLAAPANSLFSLYLKVMKATMLTESSLYIISSFHRALSASDIYRHESGRCCTLCNISNVIYEIYNFVDSNNLIEHLIKQL